MSSTLRLVIFRIAGGIKDMLHSEMFSSVKFVSRASSLGSPEKSLLLVHLIQFLDMSNFSKCFIRTISEVIERRLFDERIRCPTFLAEDFNNSDNFRSS